MVAAINAVKELASNSSDMYLKSKLQAYVVSFYKSINDHYNVLNEAKTLYSYASKVIDDELISWSARIIMRELALNGEREKIDVVLKESKYQFSGLVNESELSEVGN